MRAERVLPALALLAACTGLTPPDRGDGYTFEYSTSGEIFHWPTDRLPVRYWVAPGGGPVGDFVLQGVRAWRDQLLYREFDGVLVSDSVDADVIVQVSPPNPPEGTLSEDPPNPGACTGKTTFDLTPDDHLAGPFEILITWKGTFTNSQIVNCLGRVVMHEVGHSLGIFNHSLDPQDLMYPAPVVRYPSLNDRYTVQRLYHTAPNVAPPLQAP